MFSEFHQVFMLDLFHCTVFTLKCVNICTEIQNGYY